MKREIKRVLSLVLAFCMMLSLPGFAYAAETTDTEMETVVPEEATEASTDAAVTETEAPVVEETAAPEVTVETSTIEAEAGAPEATEADTSSAEASEAESAVETDAQAESSDTETQTDVQADETEGEMILDVESETVNSSEAETTDETEIESETESESETETETETESESETKLTMDWDPESVDTTLANKSADGDTEEQPFTGETGSNYFGDVAIVVLSDGTIVAAADAYWNGTSAGSGMDTIVSKSADGETWYYTFANYLGDNGNVQSGSSATFEGVSLATNGSTVYMLVNLYPAGTTEANAAAGTGYDADGHLLLSIDGGSSYDYYVGDYANGYANIYSTEGVQVAHYTVDEYFYLYYDGTRVSNLFFADCNFSVTPTSYLYLTKSTDGGATWSAPVILNDQVKDDADSFYGTGAGTGLVTSTGRILFTCYTAANGTDGKTSVIYSDNGGQTWTRSDDMSAQSTEGTLVQADGTIYLFTTHGGYYTSTDNGTTWSSQQTVDGISYTTTAQLSAIVYSEKIDGQTAILLTAPTSGSSAGKIFVGLVQEDGTIDWAYSYTVSEGYFDGSDLAELSDGTIALLYESAAGTVTYAELEISAIAEGAGIGSEEAEEETETEAAEAGNIVSFTDKDGYIYTASAEGVVLSAISVGVGDTIVNEDGSISIAYDIMLFDADGNEYTGAANVTLPLDEAFAGCDTFSAVVYNDDSSTADTVTVSVEDAAEYFAEATAEAEDDAEAADEAAEDAAEEEAADANDGIEVASLEVEAEEAEETEAGEENALPQEGEILSLDVPHFSTVLVTGTTSGTTTVTETKDVTVYVGYTTTITDETGNYESVYNATGLNTSIASVEVTGTTTETSSTTTYTGTLVTSAISGSTYYVGDGTNYLVLSGSTLSTTTDITQATAFTWTVSGSNRYLSSGSYYLRYNSGWSATTSTSGYQGRTNFSSYSGTLSYTDMGQTRSTGYSLYTMTENTETVEGVDATTIAITGVAVGTTSVVVGNTQYNITVEEAPAYVTTDTTPFVSNTGVGSGYAVTKLTISKTLSYDLNLDSNVLGSSDYTVVWSSADESIATVDQNGTVTGVSAGETSVTATVTFSDGSTAVYTIPVVVRDDGVDYTATLKTYDFYVGEVTDTTAYMGILYGETGSNSNVKAYDLVEVIEGEVIYIAFEANAGTAVDFFASPNEGYALTTMGSTNSANHYMALNSTSPASTDFITTSGAAGANQVSRYGSTVVYELVQKALDADCDGGMGWTRGYNETSNVTSYISFRSQKLPTVEKEITSITSDGVTTAYTEGMTAQAGDVITFTVTVTQYATTEEIEYTDEVLTDNLSGATFTASNTYTTTPTLSDSTLSSNVVTTYTVTYTITDDDLDTTITNTVDLTYTYKSAYSSGSFGGSANAEASFVATSFVGVDLVVDFGLPVSYTYEAWGKDSVILESTGSATYGIVTVTGDRTSGWTVTYTPNTVLLGVDTVTLSSTSGATYTFKVYPATTVYYEEGFATYGTGWDVSSGEGWSNNTNKGIDTQQTHIASQGGYNNYNYDEAYTGDTAGSEGTAASTTTTGNSLTFTFTGTGVDLFANCDSDSGIVGIKVTNSSGAVEKTLTVNMADTGSYASGGTAYNTPIASISSLTYGEHKVTIYLASVNSSGLKFDGFRVYGTINENSDSTTKAVYTAGLEDNPSYYELRNNVLAGLSVSSVISSSDYASELSNTLAQVYASSETGTGAIVVYSSNSDLLASETTVQDLLDDGPKNELYLDANSSVVFKITTNREVQIGLRSVTGARVIYTISDGSTTNTYTTSSSVDMFYDLQAKSSSDAAETTYTISVTSGGILSITDIKVSDYSGSIFGTLTADEVVYALTGTTYSGDDETGSTETEETEAPVTAYANLTVNLVDASGAAVASVALSSAETGIVGETAVITASEILEKAKAALPDGYVIADESSISDQSVAYGDIASIEVKVNKVAAATLTVNLVDYSVKTIATATLTSAKGVEGETAVFAAADVLAAVNEVLPSGYALVSESSVTDQSVAYGESASVNVQIGKVATLTVTYQKISGLFRTSTVGTVTLTKVQISSASSATFSSSEIKEAVPSGYKVLVATSSKVNYGSTATKTVTVY